jgi:hypothetical protein
MHPFADQHVTDSRVAGVGNGTIDQAEPFQISLSGTSLIQEST